MCCPTPRRFGDDLWADGRTRKDRGVLYPKVFLCLASSRLARQVGNIGRDPFGGPTRQLKTPAELVYPLGEVGAYGVNFHDNDLIPIDATPAEAEAIKKHFRKALADTGLVVPRATINLFSDLSFKDGAFTSDDPYVRAYALQKTMNAIDLGVEFDAKTYVFRGGRAGRRCWDGRVVRRVIGL